MVTIGNTRTHEWRENHRSDTHDQNNKNIGELSKRSDKEFGTKKSMDGVIWDTYVRTDTVTLFDNDGVGNRV